MIVSKLVVVVLIFIESCFSGMEKPMIKNYNRTKDDELIMMELEHRNFFHFHLFPFFFLL